MKRMFVGSVVLLAAALAAGTTARGSSIYVAADAFSTTTNGGTWTYGYYSASTLNPANFVAFSSYRNLSSYGYPTLQEWYTGGNATDPNVIYNSGPTDVSTYPNSGNITFHSHTLTVGPYLGPTVIRFTTPEAGNYSISSVFSTVQAGNSAPTAYVYLGSGQVFSANPIPAYANSVAYSPPGLTSLALGETVDFVVWGGNANNKTTQLDIAIINPVGSSVPLPAAAGVGFSMLGGFGALFAVRKRLSRKSRIA